MKQFPSRSLVDSLLCCWLVVTLIGCGHKKNPVDEISIADSGVEIVQSESDAESLHLTDWPQWRGPNCDGVAPDQDLPTEWSDSTNVTWSVPVPGRGHGSPVVFGDAVYLATAIEDGEQRVVIAFDRETGSEKWRKQVHQGGFTSTRSLHKKSTQANGTIACDGKQLYIGFLVDDAIVVSALDLAGELEWQREVGKFVSKFGYAPSPVLYRNLVIVAADNYGGGYLAGLDSATGEIAWRIRRTDKSSYSSPRVATVGGRDQLLISGGEEVASYDPSSGEKLWSVPFASEATCGTVVTSADHVFCSGGAFDPETVCISADGNKVWSNRTKIYEPSMIVVGNELIAVGDNGIAYAWNAVSGDQVWKKRLGGGFSASPVVCNGTIYACSLQGETHVFRSVEGRFDSIANNQLGTDAFASPAIAGGQMFMRVGTSSGRDRQEMLVCIGAKRNENENATEDTAETSAK